MKNHYNLPCNIAQTLNIIGDKWSLLIIHELAIGHETYKQIQESLGKIPTNLLSDRLKSLEEDGIVKSMLYQSHPPRYKYVLTESGRDLQGVFNSIILWGEKHLQKCYKTIVHKECGHKIEQRYYCPHCESIVSEDKIEVEESNT